MKQVLAVLGVGVLSLGLGACGKQMPDQPGAMQQGSAFEQKAEIVGRDAAHVFQAAGDITPSVASFRDALGSLNANTPGSQSGGRREINWDAVPAGFTNTDNFPADFFNQPAVGRARGTVFSTPGTGFRVSDNNFADLNPDFGGQFVFFSPVRTFAAVGSSDMTVDFFVPGSTTPATSTGFGVVFSDVDREGSAAIRLFDASGKNLGRFLAPPAPGGVSFVGVTYPTAIVARVEIESGQGAVAIGATDVSNRNQAPATDLVIMDDFIYGEPVIVSDIAQPGTATLASTTVAAKQAPTVATGGNPKGSAGDIPAFYDSRQITVNMMQLPDGGGASLIARNGSINQIYATNDLDEVQDFLPVINAIQGDGFNPLWQQNLIRFNQGFTPHQFHSDDEVLAAAAGANPEITIEQTDEMYRCSIVGH